MQHDLKYHETRLGEAQLTGWCICGGWTYKSPMLAQEPMVEAFIDHVEATAGFRGLQTSEEVSF